MNVRSCGAPSVTSSFVLAYSPSNPTISMPAPNANPLTPRLVGVVLTPTNAVRSARAAEGVRASRTRASSSLRIGVIVRDSA
jgi:hypothetical protein